MPRRGQAVKKQRSGRTKAVSYELIKPESEAGVPLYRFMNELIEKFHEDLKPARIALAWNLSWRPDVDGRVTLGKCKKASDLDRELAAFDFVIVLRKEFFEDANVKDEQRRALIDHELCHAAPKLDDTGEQIEDSKGRKVWRTRKHDLEEFSEIVARHGVWKRDIEQFAAALRMSKQGRLSMEDAAGMAAAGAGGALVDAAARALAGDPKYRNLVRKLAPKEGSVTIESGGQSVTLTAADRARMDAEHRGQA